MNAIIKEAVARAQTYMELEEEEPDFLQYGTRENGDTYDETAGRADIEEARRVARVVLHDVGGVVARVEVVDEWVMLTITPAPSK